MRTLWFFPVSLLLLEPCQSRVIYSEEYDLGVLRQERPGTHRLDVRASGYPSTGGGDILLSSEELDALAKANEEWIARDGLVYRGDSRPPQEIEKGKGFFPKDPKSFSLLSHAQGNLANTAYVATSLSPSVAAKYAEQALGRGGKSFVYQIEPSRDTFVDLNKSLQRKMGFSNYEHVAVGSIKWSQVMGWKELNAQELKEMSAGKLDLTFERNPRYRPVANPGSAVRPELAGWPAEHPAWKKEPWKRLMKDNKGAVVDTEASYRKILAVASNPAAGISGEIPDPGNEGTFTPLPCKRDGLACAGAENDPQGSSDADKERAKLPLESSNPGESPKGRPESADADKERAKLPTEENLQDNPRPGNPEKEPNKPKPSPGGPEEGNEKLPGSENPKDDPKGLSSLPWEGWSNWAQMFDQSVWDQIATNIAAGKATEQDYVMAVKKSMSDVLSEREFNFKSMEDGLKTISHWAMDGSSLAEFRPPPGMIEDFVLKMTQNAERIHQGETPEEKLKLANKDINFVAQAWSKTPVGIFADKMMTESAHGAGLTKATVSGIDKVWSYTPVGLVYHYLESKAESWWKGGVGKPTSEQQQQPVKQSAIVPATAFEDCLIRGELECKGLLFDDDGFYKYQEIMIANYDESVKAAKGKPSKISDCPAHVALQQDGKPVVDESGKPARHYTDCTPFTPNRRAP